MIAPFISATKNKASERKQVFDGTAGVHVGGNRAWPPPAMDARKGSMNRLDEPLKAAAPRESMKGGEGR